MSKCLTPAEVINVVFQTRGGEEVLDALADAGYKVVPGSEWPLNEVAAECRERTEQRNRAVWALAGLTDLDECAQELLEEDWVQAVLDD